MRFRRRYLRGRSYLNLGGSLVKRRDVRAQNGTPRARARARRSLPASKFTMTDRYAITARALVAGD
jgi:hypothetical protein